MSKQNLSLTSSIKASCSQFHQLFMHEFFAQKCFARLFSSYILALKNVWHKNIGAKGESKMLMKSTPACQKIKHMHLVHSKPRLAIYDARYIFLLFYAFFVFHYKSWWILRQSKSVWRIHFRFCVKMMKLSPGLYLLFRRLTLTKLMELHT